MCREVLLSLAGSAIRQSILLYVHISRLVPQVPVLHNTSGALGQVEMQLLLTE